LVLVLSYHLNSSSLIYLIYNLLVGYVVRCIVMVKRVVVIDCQMAGISGDMLLAALIGLGANFNKISKVADSIKNSLEGCEEIILNVKDVTRGEIQAKKVEVNVKESISERSGKQLRDTLTKCSKDLKLSREAQRFALNSLDTLLEAEAKIHNKSIEDVHLHEMGSADTLIDILGVAVAVEELGLFKDTSIYSTPVAVGGGTFKFSHGVFSSPAPATLEILRSNGFPIIGGPVEAELTTPTGAALLVNLVHETVRFYPSMIPVVVGYGAGFKNFKDLPNVLKIVVGEPFDYGLLRDEICVLETNLDDVTGEVIGHTIDRLLSEGARDVSVLPMFTKKNRPGHVLKIIVDKEDVERISRILMEETGTLGIRIIPCTRYILSRETVTIEMDLEIGREKVRLKIAKDNKGKVIQIKPEYDDVKRLAEKLNKPFREAMKLIIENIGNIKTLRKRTSNNENYRDNQNF